VPESEPDAGDTRSPDLEIGLVETDRG